MTNYLINYRRTRVPGYIPGTTPPTPILVPTANLLLWLRGDAIVGLEDGNPISTWEDTSGLGNDATAAGDLRPLYKTAILNNLPVVRFDGSDDKMSITIGAQFDSAAHLFAVVIINSGDTSYNIYNHADVDSWWRYWSSEGGYLGCFLATRVEEYPAAMPTSGAHIFELQVGGGDYEFFLDTVSKGAESGTFDAGDAVHTIGCPDDESADKYLCGDIAELLIYKAVQSSGDRTLTNNYLSAKYAL